MTSILDVAQKARVSPGTVSNVYNRPQVVKQATREKVLSVAAELGYTPNLHASRLRSGKSSMVGVLVPSISFPYSALLARGAMDALKTAGKLPVVSNTDGNSDTVIGVIRDFLNQGVTNFIVSHDQYRYDEKAIRYIQDTREDRAQIVLIGNQFSNLKGDTVLAEAQHGAKIAVEHLIQLGHRRIAYVGDQWSKGYSLPRFLGYQQGMLSNNLNVDSDLTLEMEETTLEFGINAFDRLFNLNNAPTAILSSSDQLALGVMNAAYTNGVKVPKDLSVIGFNDVPMSRLATPPLTTVSFPGYELGKSAAELLMNRLAEPDLPHQRIILPCELIVRQTTDKLTG